MSAFEDFVQLELPKRPYLDSDVAQETVIIRRGAGPRQLAGVPLGEGQVLGKVGGVLQGVAIGEGATFKKHIEVISVASAVWVIEHNKNSTNFVAQAFDDLGKLILPDEMETTDADTITVRFNTPITGSIRAIFLD